MKLIAAIGILLAFIVSYQLITRAVTRLGEAKSVGAYRLKYVNKTIGIALVAFYVILLLAYLGIESSQITLFLSSVTAVLGVALFAQWSILSNITASLIIFFGFPYRVGDTIKVVDADEDITGVVEEITLFHVLIRKGDNLITYPNSLILQKPVVKVNKRSRGKKTVAEQPSEAAIEPVEKV